MFIVNYVLCRNFAAYNYKFVVPKHEQAKTNLWHRLNDALCE
jgi:hypothetical protein